MKRAMRYAIGSLVLAFVFGGTLVLAQSTFTIEDPPVDFEVVDAEPFDGIGDNGPFSTFNDALLGTEGECRSMAEFDISPFTIPPGEYISAAVFEARITAIEIWGLGVNGETPDNLVVDGYVGNGIAELSDFQAGDGNVLGSVDTPNPWIGQVVSFDVTPFVTELVDAHETYVGLTLRAGSFGGLWLTEGAGFPKLTIETTPESGTSEQVDPSVARLLGPNAPNPFVGSTRIDYTVPVGDGGPLTLTIHDAAGRLVYLIEDVGQDPGTHSVWWNGTDLSGAAVPGGVYFYRLRWNGKLAVRPMQLLR